MKTINKKETQPVSLSEMKNKSVDKGINFPLFDDDDYQWLGDMEQEDIEVRQDCD